MKICWQWQACEIAAKPQAAIGFGHVARRLLAGLQQMPAERQIQLHATANKDVLIVLGKSELLPWVEGIEYAAPDPSGLWLPTRWQPSLPVDLIARALKQRHTRMPLLLWHQPDTLIPLDRQLPVGENHLARIATYWKTLLL